MDGKQRELDILEYDIDENLLCYKSLCESNVIKGVRCSDCYRKWGQVIAATRTFNNKPRVRENQSHAT